MKDYRGIFLLVIALFFFIFFIRYGKYNNVSTDASNIHSLAIVIPGGGLLANGSLPYHTIARLERARQLYDEIKVKNPVIITLSAGTPHKPNPRDENNFPIYESSAALRYLLYRGLPPHVLFEESISLDTIGNAFFLRCLHTEPGHLRDIIVITNNWHMSRVRAIFDTVFNLPVMTESGFKPSTTGTAYSMHYIETGAYLDSHVLHNRQQRELKSLEMFMRNVKPRWKCFKDVYDMVFTTHGAYSAMRFTDRYLPEKIDETTRESY